MSCAFMSTFYKSITMFVPPLPPMVDISFWNKSNWNPVWRI